MRDVVEVTIAVAIILVVALLLLSGLGVLRIRRASPHEGAPQEREALSPDIATLWSEIAAAGDDLPGAIERTRAFAADSAHSVEDRLLARVGLVRLLSALGRHTEALAEADALRSDPNVGTPLRHALDHARVVDLVEVGRFDDAEEVAVTAPLTGLCEDGGRSFEEKRAEIAYWRGDLDAAAGRFARLAPPASPMADVHLALIDWELGERLTAVDRLRGLTAKTPDSTTAVPFLVLASMEADLGRPADATTALGQVTTAATRNDFAARYRRLAEARVARAEGRLEEALGHFDRARKEMTVLGLRPYAAEALAERGRTRRRTGDEDGGCADLLAAAAAWRAMGCGPRADRLRAEAEARDDPRG